MPEPGNWWRGIWRQISPPRLVILLDTYLPHRTPEGVAAVEKSIAQAASLACRALESGMAVGLCVWAEGWVVFRPERGKQYTRQILAAMASVPENQSGTPQQLLDQSMGLATGEATQVLFTPLNLEVGLEQRVRGALVVIAAESPEAASYFKFPKTVDFSNCGPEGNLSSAVTTAPTGN